MKSMRIHSVSLRCERDRTVAPDLSVWQEANTTTTGR